MVDCPKCKGTGEMTVKITTVNFGKPNKVESAELNCIDCNGTGKLSKQDIADIEYEKTLWCKCTENYGVTFHKDTPQMKHHYTCKKCFKIVQIG